MIRKGAIGRLLCRYREEAVLCCILSLLYGALTMHIASTGLLTPHDGLIGAYLGYDNYYRFETAGGVFDISHPFLNGRVRAVKLPADRRVTSRLLVRP